MPSSIDGLNNMEATLGSSLSTMTTLGPKDAGKYWEDNVGHLRSVMCANFTGEKLADDTLAAQIMATFNCVWSGLPEGRLGSVQEQAKVARVLYIAVSQIQSVKKVLRVAGITNLKQHLDDITFRDRTAAEYGKPNSDEHGPVFPFATNLACSVLKTNLSTIDTRGYARKLRGMRMQVGCDARPKHNMQVEGFFAGDELSHSTAAKPVITQSRFAGHDVTVNLTDLKIDEFRLKAMGWESMGFSIPVAGIQHMLRMYGNRAITVADFGAEVPRKS